MKVAPRRVRYPVVLHRAALTEFNVQQLLPTSPPSRTSSRWNFAVGTGHPNLGLLPFFFFLCRLPFLRVRREGLGSVSDPTVQGAECPPPSAADPPEAHHSGAKFRFPVSFLTSQAPLITPNHYSDASSSPHRPKLH